MVPEEDSEASHWNTPYKLFKLLIQMNTIQDVNQSIESLDLFSMEAQQVHDLMKK